MPQANKGNIPSQGSRAPRRIFDIEQFIKLLVAGDRVGCREFLREYIAAGNDSLQALETLVWPACAAIDQLSRKDQILPIHEHAAMMLLAQLVQRLECGLVKHPARCRQVIVTSGRSPSEELAAEIFAGLAEADGFDVVFLGGGVESDDLFAEVGRRLPQFVISFAAAGSDAPRLRRLIDAVRRQDPVPGLQIGVGGGVFERVPGLAEEIGAHFSGDTPFELLQALQEAASGPRAGINRSVHARRARAA